MACLRMIALLGAPLCFCSAASGQEAVGAVQPGAESGPTTLDGVGFTATLPQGWRAWESANGQVYLMDLTSTPLGLSQDMADGQVRLLVAPVTAGTPEQLVANLAAIADEQLRPSRWQKGQAVACTRAIGGAERSGQSTRWSPSSGEGKPLLQENYAWVAGDWLIGASLRGVEGEGGTLEGVGQVLRDLVVKDFDPQALRTVPLGEFRLQVPALTPTEIKPGRNPHVVMAWGPGSIELSVMPAGASGGGAAAAHEQLAQYKTQAIAQATEMPRSIFRWFGPGLVEGLAFTVKPEGATQPVSVRTWFVPSTHEVLAISYALQDPRYQAALDAELARLWQSLEVTGFERRLARFEGYGLSLLYDPMFRFSEQTLDDGHRLLLDPLGSDTAITFEVRSGLDTANLAETLPALLQEAVTKANSTLANPSVNEVDGSFLGHAGGHAVAYSSGKEAHERYLFGAPLADGTLAVAQLDSTSRDAGDDLWTFSNLLARVETVEAKPRRVTLKSCQFLYRPDHGWRLQLTPDSISTYSKVRLFHGKDTEVVLTSNYETANRIWAGLSGGWRDADPIMRLAARANDDALKAQQSDRHVHYSIDQAFGATLPLTGSFALMRSYERRKEEQAERVSFYTFATANEIVTVLVMEPLSQDEEVEADIQELLQSLTASSQLEHEQMVARTVSADAGFQLRMPPGYQDLRGKAAESADLRIRTAGCDDAILDLSVAGAEATGTDLIAVGDLRLRATRHGHPTALALCAPAFDAMVASLQVTPD